MTPVANLNAGGPGVPESMGKGDARVTARQLPVTLISGFLGSGKTTLLEHILKSKDHGLRIAVIVNDMSSINIDAALIQQHTVSQSKEKLIQLQNGCICCTLRGDLLEELVRLARTDAVQYVVIESTGISEPMQVAETFTTEFSAAMLEQGGAAGLEGSAILQEVTDMGGLHKVARLDTTVSVLDAFNIFHNFSTSEFLSDRYGSENIIPEDERTITDLMVDQIEFADVIIVNKIDLVDAPTKSRILSLVRNLNPSARVIEAKYSKVDVQHIINTDLFSFEKAVTGAGWLRSLHELTQREIGGKAVMAPKPETEEYGISSFVYRARKPFHPKRLFNLIHDKFVVLQNAGNADDESQAEDDSDTDSVMDTDLTEEATDSPISSDIDMEDNLDQKDFAREIDPAEILKNKKASLAFRGLLRSKGFFWLATRSNQHGEWSQAGAILTLQGGGPWFASIDRDSWPEDRDVVRAIEADFSGKWGDRRIELVMIGEDLDQEAISDVLDKALLTAPEMRRWERVMGNKNYTVEQAEDTLCQIFEDGFEEWGTIVTEDESEGDHNNHRH
ncbi:CobW-domain-containing protein [Coleophoma cylindrospora]|uniref:CobW-domain-containing protein n=1 Tax=Coleophoma cylindrospora TaxID=1849047 RepID=A0A3D8QXS3_9HELO|nr:CobW-domain-containing protein [Coleophoma cylindrospora]